MAKVFVQEDGTMASVRVGSWIAAVTSAVMSGWTTLAAQDAMSAARNASTPQVWNQVAENLEYRELQVTNEHRFQRGVMSAHWGHHLGHLVRTRTNGLWFVDDTGNDVNITPRARYYQLVDDTAWVWRADITNGGTVQQNTASVAIGDTIYTYGIDIATPALVENWLNTQTLASGTKAIRYIVSNTNYIGAAVTPSGGRIVWWTNVVDGGGPASWYYTWHDGTRWKPMVTSSVPSNDFSYVLIAWANDSTFYAAGEAVAGIAPNWTYDLGAGKVVLGKPMSEFTSLKGTNYTASDLWVNPANGDLHILGDGGGKQTYYYRAAGAPWPDSGAVLTNPVTIYRGTRFIEAPDGFLYLFLSTPTGSKFKRIDRNLITGKIPLDSLTTHDVHNTPGFNYTFALFPEVKTCQTTPVQGINFAYPGNDYDFGHIIRHFTVRKQWPVEVLTPPRRPAPSLNQNTPNPFNPATAIRFTLQQPATANLTLFDLHGKTVQVLVNRSLSAGVHEVTWDGLDGFGRPVASGVYVYRLTAGNSTIVRRMTLLR
jgi:hypothetical protein